MMNPAEYKKLYLEDKLPKTDYDDCRFAEDKYQFAKTWLLKRQKCNVDDPQTIVDVICKQKLDIIKAPTRNVLKMQQWADKISAYSRLMDLGLGGENGILIPAYSLSGYPFKRCKNIEPNLFENLKDEKFILKTNHGSGWNYIHVPGKTDLNNMCDKVNEWLSLNYAYISGYERQYEKIKPGIICQPILVDQPVDWSFWCVKGNIEGISLTKKLGKNLEDYIAFVDVDGKQNPWYIGAKPQMKNLNHSQVEILKKMIPYVNKLADGENFVRVDLYYVNGQIYFGEKTYTPCSGVLDLTFISNH